MCVFADNTESEEASAWTRHAFLTSFLDSAESNDGILRGLRVEESIGQDGESTKGLGTGTLILRWITMSLI